MQASNHQRGAAGLSPAAFSHLWWRWLASGAATGLFAGVLTMISPNFGSDVEVGEMPVVPLVVFLMFAGAAFALCTPLLLGKTAGVSREQERSVLVIIVASGLLARLVLFGSQPILENDYYRYLWDGAVAAHGHNPYAVSPVSALNLGNTGELGTLAANSQHTLERIGHKGLTTIYPPVAQAAFAFAHLLRPWSLGAWRSVMLAADLATLLLLISILRAIGRSALWSALYWLNPIVLKEVFNSGHMDAIVSPLVLLALLVALRRPMLATLALGLAAGAKLWPVLLAPLIWRPILANRGLLAACAAVLTALSALSLMPTLTVEAGETSGLTAYVEQWKTNSALFPALEPVVGRALEQVGAHGLNIAVATKGLLGLVLMGVVLLQSMRPLSGLEDLVARASHVIVALVLLSPAQYPWYAVWLAPLLPFRPYRAFLVLTATMPLYYLFFHLAARDSHDIFTGYVVWMIWLPVWIVLAWDGMRSISSQLHDCPH